MALDLWFREDVARILAATEATMKGSLTAVCPLDPEAAEAYRQGFDQALQAMSIAFGLQLRAGVGPGRPSQAPPLVDVSRTATSSNSPTEEW